jgi:NADH:ubiquinone oxidoreductase subunit 5 (subunit L)/multisubunit Na+/H+ antiporter MnhA subunit
MWFLMAILALFCVIFGIFATGFIIPELFTPVVGAFTFNGLWSSSLVSLMVLISIILGFLIYLATGKKKFRAEENFIGGENAEKLGASFPATEFYKTLTEFKFFSRVYKRAEEKHLTSTTFQTSYAVVQRKIEQCSYRRFACICHLGMCRVDNHVADNDVYNK